MTYCKQTVRIFQRFPVALLTSIRRLREDEVLVRASSLAYSSMLAMVPVAAVSLSVFSNFTSFHDASLKLKAMVIKTFLPGIGSELQAVIDHFLANANSLSFIGLLGLILSSALLMYEIHVTFNKLFCSFDNISLREKLLEFWAIITGLPFAVLSVVSISSSVLDRYGTNMGNLFSSWEAYAIPWFVFLLLLLMFSPKKTALVATVIGASVGCIAYRLAEFVFIEYVSLPIMPNMLYGALAVVPLLLLWLLVAWTIIIFSAILTAELIKEE